MPLWKELSLFGGIRELGESSDELSEELQLENSSAKAKNKAIFFIVD